MKLTFAKQKFVTAEAFAPIDVVRMDAFLKEWMADATVEVKPFKRLVRAGGAAVPVVVVVVRRRGVPQRAPDVPVSTV